jgi:DNA-binding transcriptional LysR family regulator
MERRDIEVLLTLADELHFARTAERLHLSVPAVSQTIRKLERQIGAPLFTRTTRRVELTPLGRQLADELRPAHEQIAGALDRAIIAARGVRQRLEVGYMSAAVGERVLRLSDELQAVVPECEVHIRETALADLFGPLRRGEVDVAVLPLPVQESDLTVGPVLLSEPALAAMPATHRLAGRRHLDPADLAGESLVFVQGLPQYWVDAHLHDDTTTYPTGRIHTVSGFQELLMHVMAGRGLAVVGAQTPRLYPRDGLVCIPFRPPRRYDYAVVWRTGEMSQSGQAFIQLSHRRHPGRTSRAC